MNCMHYHYLLKVRMGSCSFLIFSSASRIMVPQLHNKEKYIRKYSLMSITYFS